MKKWQVYPSEEEERERHFQVSFHTLSIDNKKPPPNTENKTYKRVQTMIKNWKGESCTCTICK